MLSTLKRFSFFSILLVAFFSTLLSCNNATEEEKIVTTTEQQLKEENITYTGDGVTMNGYIVYDESKEGERPAVIVVPEWWGLNDYAKMRADELAKLGYIAMAIDMYGSGAQADNPDSATKISAPFYSNPEMAKKRFDAALDKLKTFPQVDTSKLAAIGYCFGGAQVLTMAKLGDNLKGVVSFHGNLNVVPANKDLLKAAILVCHGGSDPFVPETEVIEFKKQMNAIGADYTFKVYEGSTHAFTNPASTENGKKFNLPLAYNPAADTASWNDMKDFFERIFK